MSDGGPFHAFVDESIRDDGYYRLTAVRVHARDIASVGRAIRSLVLRGQRRLHLTDESDRRKRLILGRLAALPVEVSVYTTPYNRRTSDQPARDRCLHALALDVDRHRVAVVVLDSRGPHRDRLDRLALAAVLDTAGLDHVTYTHRGSRDDPLLALPDAFGWAVGAGPTWRRLAADVTEVRDVGETG